MPAIDHKAVRKVMDRAPMTTKQLTEELHRRGVEVSHDYVVNIVNGHRRLKRNPVLRHEIARALDVPVHWIEVQEAKAS